MAVMKLTVCLVALLSAGVAQAQSLKDTTDWLHEFMLDEGSVRGGDWRDRYHMVADGCEVTILHDSEDVSCTRLENKKWCRGDWPHVTPHHFKQVFHLKDIDPARIAIQSESSLNGYAVKLATISGLPRVAHSVKMGDMFTKQTGDSALQAYVVLPTPQGAQSVAKAFQHAAALCKAKASPF